MFRMRRKHARPLSKASGRRRDPELAREEALRPCPLLGFDRDQLGCYLVGRGALELAESQFRRAAWLNPYEPSFQVHWALALIKLHREADGREVLQKVLADHPDNMEALELWRENWPDEHAVPRAKEARS